MVVELRPRPRVLIEQDDARASVPRRHVLMGRHIRPNGENTAHSCAICQVELAIYTGGDVPDWVQCPECQDVLHQKCLMKWAAQAEGDKFSCPACRASFAVEGVETDPDMWDGSAAIDAVLGELESDDASDDDDDSDDDDSDDDDSDDDDSDDADSDDDDSDDDDNDDDEGDDSDGDSGCPVAKRTRLSLK